MSLSTLTNIIQRRRSIFPPMYTGEEVDDQTIVELLTNANQAPSHKKTNPWRFHVIAGKKKKELSAFFQETYKEHTPEDKYSETKFKKLGKNPKKASHVIAIGMHLDPDSGLPEWEETAAVATAIQNLYLSVTAAHLGGYWSSPKLMMEHIHQFIDLGENEKCIGFFYIGVPQDGLNLRVDKGDAKDKTTWYK